jgi:hypothetical protein
MKRMSALCLLLSLFVAGWMTASRAGSRLIGGTAERQVFTGGQARFGCAPIDCVIAPGQVGPFVFSDLGTYDATITMSFRYRTSPGEGGRVWLTIDRGAGPAEVSPPGKSWLAPSALGTTTTATWVARGLGAGADYSIGIQVNAGRGSHDRSFFIELSRAVVDVQATSAD